MKKTSLSLLFAAPLLLGLSGCVVSVGGDRDEGYRISSDYEDREYDNRQAIAGLALGSSFTHSLNTLGVADFTETFMDNEQKVQVLYYRTHRTKEDGMTTKDECTYLYFVDGLLKETGNGGEFSRNLGH
ncbi:DUF3192 domain-containing protein [Thalassomonas actiniarum]|uniref:DUF3192 domain-containing protein n=1 Tax=Thalassomonas actiniarum TaxID=485447 RepID=A0AAF0C1Q8_9GAMM|nr:DUF3192 domain-containing protein [Thalassomonas actiniarum]WDD97702.1 DUF3192 domain-containing protein [Thalassomonas actiniarum]